MFKIKKIISRNFSTHLLDICKKDRRRQWQWFNIFLVMSLNSWVCSENSVGCTKYISSHRATCKSSKAIIIVDILNLIRTYILELLDSLSHTGLSDLIILKCTLIFLILLNQQNNHRNTEKSEGINFAIILYFYLYPRVKVKNYLKLSVIIWQLLKIVTTIFKIKSLIYIIRLHRWNKLAIHTMGKNKLLEMSE